MERLNRIQNGALRSSHKSNPKNRSKFFDCVSTLLLYKTHNKEQFAFLQEMTKLDLNLISMRVVND